MSVIGVVRDADTRTMTLAARFEDIADVRPPFVSTARRHGEAS